MQLISFQFNLFVGVNSTHCLHQLLVLESSVPPVDRVLPKAANASSFDSLQKQHQVVISQVYILSVPNPFFDFRSKQVALVVAVHDVGARFSVLCLKEIEHDFFLLEGLFPSGQLDAGIGTILEGIKRFVEVTGFLCHWVVHDLMDKIPFNILVVLEDFDLNGLLSDLVLDSFLLQVIEYRTNSLVQTCRDIQQVNLPSDLFDHRELLLHS